MVEAAPETASTIRLGRIVFKHEIAGYEINLSRGAWATSPLFLGA